MARQNRDSALGRFGEPGLLILLALSDGPKHGYAIAEDVLAEAGVKLGPGTLYGALTSLVDRGLIAPLPADDRRRPYEITDDGRVSLANHLERWGRVVTTGRTRLGLT